jgi:hypothetical protein
MIKCQRPLHLSKRTLFQTTLSKRELLQNGKGYHWLSSCMLISGLENPRGRLQITLGILFHLCHYTWHTDRASSRVRRISLAYSYPALASVELVQAMLRQGTFVEKMVNMGWTTGGRFDALKAQAMLVRCIARYHGFLWLMATIPGHLLVPTLVSHRLCTHSVPRRC